jgi:Uma2 family endonuclease
MPAGLPASIEEYLSTSYEHDCDFVDGAIAERTGGFFDHSRLQGALAAHLRARRQAWRANALLELRIRVSPTRVRVADICLISKEAPVEQIPSRPPMLCIEIWAPDDRMIRMEQRIGDYLAMGVPCVWIFDPEDRSVLECTPSGRRVVTETELKLANTHVLINLPELFADLD